MSFEKSIKLSVVIPAFNRGWCITNALDSARRFLSKTNGGEIVVVDDGSSDDTVDQVRKFINTIQALDIELQLIVQEKNQGVCAAKNAGAKAATGEWLVFLDSDDQLIEAHAENVIQSIKNSQQIPLHFYRCIGENNEPIGQPIHQDTSCNLNEFILFGTRGESLPVIHRSTFLRFRYDEDINGFEGLCYARIIQDTGPAMIHSIIARRYFTSHEQRLSSRSGVAKRSRSLARGYLRLLKDHFHFLNYKAIVHISTRWIYHSLRSLVY